jgi:hypothetical protein
MKTKKTRALLVPPLLLSAALLFACAAESRNHKPEPAAGVSPAPSQEAPSEQDDAEKASEPHEEESKAQSPGAFDQEPRSAEQKRKTRLSLMEGVDTEMLSLESAIQPEQLSCSGAAPHRDAICSLAERICNINGPSTDGQLGSESARDCEKAKKTCSEAKKRYAQRCS